MGISTRALMGIAAVGGLVCGITGLTVMQSQADKVRSAPYYKAALELLDTSPAAKSLLGPTHRVGRFEINSNTCRCDGQSAYFQVPVDGPKAAAQYYFWAENQVGGWTVTRAELEPAAEPGRRLVIVRGPDTPLSQ